MADTGPETILFDVFLTNQRRKAMIARALEGTGLPPEDYPLYVFVGAEGPWTPTGLAARLGMPLSTVLFRVRRLERRGHAERMPNPEDGRSFLIRLTDEGQRLLAVARPSVPRARRGGRGRARAPSGRAPAGGAGRAAARDRRTGVTARSARRAADARPCRRLVSARSWHLLMRPATGWHEYRRQSCDWLAAHPRLVTGRRLATTRVGARRRGRTRPFRRTRRRLRSRRAARPPEL